MAIYLNKNGVVKIRPHNNPTFGTTPQITNRVPKVVYDATYSKIFKQWIACVRGSDIVAFRHTSKMLVEDWCFTNSNLKEGV